MNFELRVSSRCCRRLLHRCLSAGRVVEGIRPMCSRRPALQSRRFCLSGPVEAAASAVRAAAAATAAIVAGAAATGLVIDGEQPANYLGREVVD